MPATFDSFLLELTRLVESFEHNLSDHKKSSYVEAQLRDDFLNPFFAALGWDIANTKRLIQKKREVEIESRTQIAGRQKRADYLFRVDERDRFVCEAKKPAEELHARHCFQAKRYAWNKQLPIAVLTDFEDFKLFVVGGKPHIDESSEVGLYKRWHFKELPTAAREIWELLSRDSVAGGSIEKLIEGLPKKSTGKGKLKQGWLIKPDRSRSLDVDFLNFLDEARRELASDLLRENDRDDLLHGNKLNEATQRILDRILFLRICEDRDIDTGMRLDSHVATWRRATGKDDGARRKQSSLELHEEPAHYGFAGVKAPKDSLWRQIVRHFRNLDRRPPSHVPFFNGNLFKPHFSEELIVSDDWLAGFISDLSADESPYLFAYIPVEILGTIYERFLGKVVRPQGKGVTIEKRPDLRKESGVYYTPRYVVEYIVAQTVEKLLEGKKPEATLKLRFLDPACGSGSFLIRVFEACCEHWQQYLTDHPEERKKKWCWIEKTTGVTEDVHLTMALKREILLSNVFGVDLDPGAVEVTQLSLYLKMLENENRNTLQRERALLPEDDHALLPPLEKNIQCGNSLVASDFSMMAEELIRIRAFDWDVAFREILKSGGFDAVVGNPPYNLLQPQNVPEPELAYFHERFKGAQYKVDLYHLFIEKSLTLVREGGLFSFITPAPFTTNNYTTNLREIILTTSRIRELVTVPDGVFDEASVDNAIFCFERCRDATARDSNEAHFIEAKAGKLGLVVTSKSTVNQSIFQTTPGKIFRPPRNAGFGQLEQKILEVSKPLGDLARVNFGMQLRDRKKFPGDVLDGGVSGKPKAPYRPCLTGKNINRYFTEYSNLYCLFDRSAQQGGCWDEAIQFAKTKIIVRQIGEVPIASYDENAYCCLNTVFMIKPTVKNVEERFLLAILNSKLIAFFWRNKFSDYKEAFPKIKGTYLQQLPIPVHASAHAQAKLSSLVEKMLTLTPKLRAAKSDHETKTLQNAVTATDQQIDALVFELYGLTEEEIKIVEQATA